MVANQPSLTTLVEVPVSPDRNMTTSGWLINPGITSRAKYDHISIVLSIPVDTGRVEATGVPLSAAKAFTLKTFHISSLGYR